VTDLSKSIQTLLSLEVSAAKIVSSQIVGIRYQKRSSDPAAQPVLQIAHPWEQGGRRGVDWMDVPTVDEHGEPL
jgi:hypothetical protein